MKSILKIGDQSFAFESAKDAVNVLEALSESLGIKEVDTFGESDFSGWFEQNEVELSVVIKDFCIADDEQVKTARKEYEKNMSEYRVRRAEKTQK